MPTIAEKIADIEFEISRTQKNKATAAHLGRLRAKLALLKREQVSGASKGSAGSHEGFAVKAAGDARVGYVVLPLCCRLVGFPSVGKSTLLTRLTGKESEAAEYAFTTVTCIPGEFRYKGCRIQLLDLPGIIQGAKDNTGRGRQVIGVAKTCDVVLLVLDASKPLSDKKLIEAELEGFGIRCNKEKPNIVYRKREKGGIQVSTPVKQSILTTKICQEVCKEFKVNNAEFTLRCDATVQDLVDVVIGNVKYMKVIYVLNMIGFLVFILVDKISIEELSILDKMRNVVPISAKQGWNLEDLLETIWTTLDFDRIYTKPKGQALPNYKEPMVMPKNSTVLDLCKAIHKSMEKQFKHAWVWGTSVQHTPQLVGKNHVLHDEDIVQIVKRVGA